MTTFRKLLTAIWNEDSGQDLVEYALVATFIGLGCVAAMSNIATSIATTFGTVGTTLTTGV